VDEDDEYRVGVLLLNLGGPETLDDVQPFLYNLFADPDIIRLPPAAQFLQGFLASVLSASRAPKSREAYESIGGGSPLRRITDAQAQALQTALEARGIQVKTYVGMRYWKPFTEDAIDAIKRDAVTRLVVLPLYPQFSISTSGSSLRLLEQYFSEDQDLANVRHTVIPSWYQRPGYIKAMALLIAQTLKDKFEEEKEPIIFFSAHGVPVSYVEDAGDPYKVEMEECVKLIVQELRSMGVENEHILAYQSRVGPVEWLKPYTDDTIRELGKKGTKAMCAVPISFVSEHIETLEEIDMEYRELAEEFGIEKWGRVPALDTDPIFIDDLAEAVIEALPYTTRMNKSARSAGPSIPPGSVGELLASYDRERLAIPVPDSSWNKGAKKSAEKSDLFSGSSSDLVNVAIVTLVVFVFLQYLAGANGLFGSFGVFKNW
jgi:ferrochelatase